MASSVETYLSARTEFITIQNELHKIRDTVATVASSLQSRPGHFMFSNLPLGMPAEVGMSRDSVSVDAKQWPTAEQIQNKLRQWHEARDKMLSLWRGLPTEHQAAMQPPPGMRN